MKTFTALIAAVALLGGVTIASAQNQPTTTPQPAPNSINKGSLPNKPSGAESQKTAKTGHMKRRHVAKKKSHKSSSKSMKMKKPDESSTMSK